MSRRFQSLLTIMISSALGNDCMHHAMAVANLNAACILIATPHLTTTSTFTTTINTTMTITFTTITITTTTSPRFLQLRVLREQV